MKNLLYFIIPFISLYMNAQEISVEQARMRAADFILKTESSHNQSQIKSRYPLGLSLAYSANEGNMPELYVFNISYGGYIVMGAQEFAEPVLAYSDEGSFDINTANPNLKYWIQFCQRQIKAAADAGIEQSSVSDEDGSAEKTDIPALLTTAWDQKYPYNEKSPMVSGKRGYTGCVATAMAQVMKYHEWPEKGIGSHYYIDTFGCMQTIHSDFSSHTYDWANMKNRYSSKDSSEVEIAAVAQLMLDVGVAVEMEYTRSGSAAYTEHCPYALVNFFGYDKGVRHVYRDVFPESEWEEMLYHELDEGRPVLYGGTDDGNGHCFVCDGYDASTDMYHFNWGWTSSGYCKLNVITTIGYTFDQDQDMVIGIQPPVEDSKPVHALTIDLQSYLEVGAHPATEDRTTYDISFGSYYYQGMKYDGTILNDSWEGFDAIFTLKYTNQETGEEYYAGDPLNAEINRYHFNPCYSMDYYDYDSQYFMRENLRIQDVKVPELPDGMYHVTLVWKHYEDRNNDDVSLWTEVPSHAPYRNYVELEIGDVGINNTLRRDFTSAHTIHNLNGQRMNTLNQGINIVDGIKVLKR